MSALAKVAWLCSNPSHGRCGVMLLSQPKAACSCGRRFVRVSLAGGKCRNCGAGIHYWTAGAPCQLCGGDVQSVASKASAA